MFQRKPRRFRRHTTGRGHTSHGNGHGRSNSFSNGRSNSFSNGQTRNNFRPTQSAEKLLEKYNTLAKEAMSSGDKTLCENYLQHADHFTRIIEDKNKSREQFKNNTANKTTLNEQSSAVSSDIKQEEEIKTKE
jgi:hypothetical protein